MGANRRAHTSAMIEAAHLSGVAATGRCVALSRSHSSSFDRRRRKIRIADRDDRQFGRASRVLMQMLGSFAEFEREMIRERTHGGLHEARAESHRLT